MRLWLRPRGRSLSLCELHLDLQCLLVLAHQKSKLVPRKKPRDHLRLTPQIIV